MLSSSRIQSFIDELLTSHGCYQPVDLLLKTGRLPYSRYEAWCDGKLALLEDGMAGNLEQVEALLYSAAACAAQLGLQPQSEGYASPVSRADGPPRIFRKPHINRLASTVYRRVGDSPQLNLFLDNHFAQVRKRFCLALLEHDAGTADKHLAEMAHVNPDNEFQADGEQLVDALAWLDRPCVDSGGLLALIEAEIIPCARRLLAEDSVGFLAPFWRHLASALPARQFDPRQPRLHTSWAAMQVPDWPAVIASVLAVGDYQQQPVLLERLATAALAQGDRRVALDALCRLCWQAPAVAEQWLARTRDPALNAALDRFWDLDSELEMADFPAWLMMLGLPLPEYPAPEEGATRSRQACHALQMLRNQPEHLATRRWLKDNHPRLFRCWIERRDRQ